jgi:hypothetical protein
VRDLAWKLGPSVVTGSDLLFPFDCSPNISTAVSAREFQRVGPTPKAAQVCVYLCVGSNLCPASTRLQLFFSSFGVLCYLVLGCCFNSFDSPC